MATTTLEPQAFDLKQSSRILNLSEKVTRDLVRKNLLHSVRVGRRHVISQKAIDRFLSGEADARP